MIRTRSPRLGLGLVIAAAAILGGLPTAAASAGTPGELATTAVVRTASVFSTTVPSTVATCTEVRLPVALRAGLTKDVIVAGTMCVPRAWAPGRHAVDILVHGGMYNRQYWDWPVRPEVYSYARRTVQAGRATFFYDRLGAGSSTRLPGPQASFMNDVYGLHQVVEWLRGTYPVVNSIGHSLGSVVVLQEAGQYNDTDRVVATGLTHGHGLGFLLLPTMVYTALLDPQFADMDALDGAYITTLPGKRDELFYSASAESPVIAWDEAHKDVMTGSQASEAIAALTQPPLLNWSNRITARVLMVNGQQDAPFCNVDVSCLNDQTLTAAEMTYFTGARSFNAKVVPDTGHDLPLHPSAASSFAIINTWLTSG
jgi:pimeloyl-ACP methyl ester carboxylesterase